MITMGCEQYHQVSEGDTDVLGSMTEEQPNPTKHQCLKFSQELDNSTNFCQITIPATDQRSEPKESSTELVRLQDLANDQGLDNWTELDPSYQNPRDSHFTVYIKRYMSTKEH